MHYQQIETLGSRFRRIREPFSNADKQRVFLLKAKDSPKGTLLFQYSSTMDCYTLGMSQNICTLKKRLKYSLYIQML